MKKTHVVKWVKRCRFYFDFHYTSNREPNCIRYTLYYSAGWQLALTTWLFRHIIKILLCFDNVAGIVFEQEKDRVIRASDGRYYDPFDNEFIDILN